MVDQPMQPCVSESAFTPVARELQQHDKQVDEVEI
jgi:hypothetical protein